jgi:hypothetical protein
VSGISVEIQGFAVTGHFAVDASYFDEGTIAGSIDTRPLDSLAGGSEGTICGYASALGASCEACPSDGEDFCLTLRVEEVYGEEISGVSVVPVAGNNCEGCDEGPPAPDAVCEG